MLSYLAPILVFGLVIFVHELGHFLAAKALGVYAPRFSIGFGPALLKFRRGETEYVLALLPFGGFVRMASRLDEESAFLEGGSEEKDPSAVVEWEDPNGMIPFGPNPVPENRWFESKSLPARVVIMIAGVTMNILLAFALYTGMALHSGRETIPTTVIGNVPEIAGSPQLARLHIGDTILAVNSKPVTSWGEVLNAVASTGRALEIRTNRDDVAIALNDSVTVERILTDLDYYVPAVIDSVIEGQAAAAAGFQHNDSIVSIDGAPVSAWVDLTKHVGAASGRPLVFQIVRTDGPHTISVTPKATEVVNPFTGKTDTVGKIGAGRRNLVHHEPVGVADAFGSGARSTREAAGGVIKIVHDLFAGSVSVKQLGGPIAITKLSVSAAKSGFETLLRLIAFLSVNIAVLNLLPIPILDGGQILINVVETAKGSPFSPRIREYILRVGLVAIGLLFVTVMFNDTKGWFVQLFTWVTKGFGRA